MTLKTLNEIVKRNNVPENVSLLSDSGWENGPTGVGRAFYNSELNTIVFTQEYNSSYYDYEKDSRWKLLQ